MTAGKRFPGLPDVPTAIEAGVGGYDVASWNALAAPGKVPRAVVERVHQELAKALAAPEVQKRFEELGVEPRISTPEFLREFFVSESKRWTPGGGGGKNSKAVKPGSQSQGTGCPATNAVSHGWPSTGS